MFSTTTAVARPVSGSTSTARVAAGAEGEPAPAAADAVRAADAARAADAPPMADAADAPAASYETVVRSGRDGTDPKALLQMATTNGAIALGLDPQRFTLTPGNHPLGLLAIPIEPGTSDSWAGAMQSNEPPEWVCIRA
ncbi:MAG: hypothetical protein L3K26_12155 [Candidatus Hydrogenedentes bacterium]|nr:hypothetical protein [Candidatus Hydrogenedentota bacterium]